MLRCQIIANMPLDTPPAPVITEDTNLEEELAAP